MSKRGIVRSAIFCVLAGVIAFALGVRLGAHSLTGPFRVHYAGVQAMLAFNRLQDERHWEELLKKGCFAQATKAIDVAQDQDTKLLAEFLNGGIDQSTLTYIRARDAALVGELRTFKSKYGDRWTEEACGR